MSRAKKIVIGAAIAFCAPPFIGGMIQGAEQSLAKPTLTARSTAASASPSTRRSPAKPTPSPSPTRTAATQPPATTHPATTISSNGNGSPGGPTISSGSGQTTTGTSGDTFSGSSGSSSEGNGQPPVILSPSGNYYRAGEFCPNADAGLSTVDAHGYTITCVLESGRYHWHY